MDRKKFVELLGGGTVALSLAPFLNFQKLHYSKNTSYTSKTHFSADLVIVGGGLGGCAAALGALRNGLSIVMTEETDWIGGQLTAQGVPPDENPWMPKYGCTQSFRDLLVGIREYYKKYYPLISAAKTKKYLNPGDGSVSRLCSEPRVALTVLYNMFAPYISSRKLTLLLRHKVTDADVKDDKVRSLKAYDQLREKTIILNAPYFIDATELGDLLPITNTKYVTGTESKKQTGELHAPKIGDPANQQAFTSCFAMDYIAGSNHIIDKPKDYNFWRNFKPDLQPPWPGKLLALDYTDPFTGKPKKLGFNPKGGSGGNKLNLWIYRRIINPKNFKSGTYAGGITLVNWPQNDYMLGNLVGVPKQRFNKHMSQAKQLSLSLLYWLQTEVPRPDGKQGWPGLRLRPDILGTGDGLAKYPYIRESRRIKAVFTILEKHVGKKNRAMVTNKDPSKVVAASFYDSIGIGFYNIDLHPTSRGDNYIDIEAIPFQIPMGALLPKTKTNLLAGCKNIGTTHITNGCYRLHPVEWNIGEVAGMMAAFALKKGIIPRDIRENNQRLKEFQDLIRSQGVETHWPESVIKH
jgi:hypothetical protein